MKKIISIVLVITFAWNQTAYATGEPYLPTGRDFSSLRPLASGVFPPAEGIIEALTDKVYYASPAYLPHALKRINEFLSQPSLPEHIREKAKQLKSEIEQRIASRPDKSNDNGPISPAMLDAIVEGKEYVMNYEGMIQRGLAIQESSPEAALAILSLVYEELRERAKGDTLEEAVRHLVRIYAEYLEVNEFLWKVRMTLNRLIEPTPGMAYEREYKAIFDALKALKRPYSQELIGGLKGRRRVLVMDPQSLTAGELKTVLTREVEYSIQLVSHDRENLFVLEKRGPRTSEPISFLMDMSTQIGHSHSCNTTIEPSDDDKSSAITDYVSRDIKRFIIHINADNQIELKVFRGPGLDDWDTYIGDEQAIPALEDIGIIMRTGSAAVNEFNTWLAGNPDATYAKKEAELIEICKDFSPEQRWFKGDIFCRTMLQGSPPALQQAAGLLVSIQQSPDINEVLQSLEQSSNPELITCLNGLISSGKNEFSSLSSKEQDSILLAIRVDLEIAGTALTAKEYFLLTKVNDLEHGNITAAKLLISHLSEQPDDEASRMLGTIRLRSDEPFIFFVAGQSFFNNYKPEDKPGGYFADVKGIHIVGSVIIIKGESYDLKPVPYPIVEGRVDQDANGNTIVQNLTINGKSCNPDRYFARKGKLSDVYPERDTVTVDKDTPDEKKYVVYINGNGIIKLLDAKEYGKVLLHEIAHSVYFTELRLAREDEDYFIEHLEAAITSNKDVWPEVAANIYNAHQSSIATPTITGTWQNTAPDLMSVTIDTIDGESITGLEALALKRKSVNLSDSAWGVWVLDGELIEHDGRQYEVMFCPAIGDKPILLPVRTIITEALADLFVDLQDKWDKDAQIIINPTYPKQNELKEIPEVDQYLYRVYERLETSDLNPAMYETLANASEQASELEWARNFLAGLDYDWQESLENFKRILKDLGKRLPENVTISLDGAEHGYNELKLKPEPDRMKFIESVIAFSLTMSNKLTTMLNAAYGIAESKGVGKKISKIASTFGERQIQVYYAEDIAEEREWFQLSDADFDENGLAAILLIPFTEVPRPLEMPRVIHEIGHSLLKDRVSTIKYPSLRNLITGSIKDNGYLDGLVFDFSKYNSARYFNITPCLTELVAEWFPTQFMPESIPEAEFRRNIHFLAPFYIEKDLSRVGIEHATFLIALVEFGRNTLHYNIPETDELTAIEQWAKAENEALYNQLLAGFTTFLEGLSLKMLDEYYMQRLQSDNDDAKQEAVASLKNRLGDDEYEDVRNEYGYITDIVVHDYKTLDFETPEARDAALDRLLINPPTRIGEIDILTGTVEEVPIEGGNAVVLTSVGRDAKIVAIPHTIPNTNEPVIMFHLLTKIPIPVNDRSREETPYIKSIRAVGQDVVDELLNNIRVLAGGNPVDVYIVWETEYVSKQEREPSFNEKQNMLLQLYRTMSNPTQLNKAKLYRNTILRNASQNVKDAADLLLNEIMVKPFADISLSRGTRLKTLGCLVRLARTDINDFEKLRDSGKSNLQSLLDAMAQGYKLTGQDKILLTHMLDITDERGTIQKGENVDEALMKDILTPGTAENAIMKPEIIELVENFLGTFFKYKDGQLVPVPLEYSSLFIDVISELDRLIKEDPDNKQYYEGAKEAILNSKIELVTPRNKSPGIFIYNEHEYCIAFSDVATNTISLPKVYSDSRLQTAQGRKNIIALIAHEATDLYAMKPVSQGGLGLSKNHAHQLSEMVEKKIAGVDRHGRSKLDVDIAEEIKTYLCGLRARPMRSEEMKYAHWLKDEFVSYGVPEGFALTTANACLYYCMRESSALTQILDLGMLTEWETLSIRNLDYSFRAGSLAEMIKEDIDLYIQSDFTHVQVNHLLDRLIPFLFIEEIQTYYPTLINRNIAHGIGNHMNYIPYLIKLGRSGQAGPSEQDVNKSIQKGQGIEEKTESYVEELKQQLQHATEPAEIEEIIKKLMIVGTHYALQISLDEIRRLTEKETSETQLTQQEQDKIEILSEALNSIALTGMNIIKEDITRAMLKKIAGTLGVHYTNPDGPQGLTLSNGLILLAEGGDIAAFTEGAFHAAFAAVYSNTGPSETMSRKTSRDLVTDAITQMDNAPGLTSWTRWDGRLVVDLTHPAPLLYALAEIMGEKPYARDIILHRANTRDLIEFAKNNADGIEIDVQMTKDGQLALYHDELVKDTQGKIGAADTQYRIYDLTLTQLRQVMPVATLDEAIEQCGPDVKYYLHISDRCSDYAGYDNAVVDKVTKKVNELMTSKGIPARNITISSFREAQLNMFMARRMANELDEYIDLALVLTRLSDYAHGEEQTIEHWIDKAKENGFDGIGLATGDATQDNVDAINQAGLKVSCGYREGYIDRGIYGLVVEDSHTVIAARDAKKIYILNQLVGFLARLEAKAILDLTKAGLGPTAQQVKMEMLNEANRADFPSMSDEEFRALLQFKNILFSRPDSPHATWTETDDFIGYESITLPRFQLLRRELKHIRDANVTPGLVDAVAHGDQGAIDDAQYEKRISDAIAEGDDDALKEIFEELKEVPLEKSAKHLIHICIFSGYSELGFEIDEYLESQFNNFKSSHDEETYKRIVFEAYKEYKETYSNKIIENRDNFDIKVFDFLKADELKAILREENEYYIQPLKYGDELLLILRRGVKSACFPLGHLYFIESHTGHSHGIIATSGLDLENELANAKDVFDNTGVKQFIIFINADDEIELAVFNGTGWDTFIGDAEAIPKLQEMGIINDIDAVAEILSNGNPDNRIAAIEALGKTGTPEAAEELIKFISSGEKQDERVKEAAGRALESIKVSEFAEWQFFVVDASFFKNYKPEGKKRGYYTGATGIHLPGGIVIINGGHQDLVAKGYEVTGDVVEIDGETIIRNLKIDGTRYVADEYPPIADEYPPQRKGPRENIYPGLDTVTVGEKVYVPYARDDGEITLLDADRYGSVLAHETAISAYLTLLREDEDFILQLEDAIINDRDRVFSGYMKRNVTWTSVWPSVVAYAYNYHKSSIGAIDIPTSDVTIGDGTVTIKVGRLTYEVPVVGIESVKLKGPLEQRYLTGDVLISNDRQMLEIDGVEYELIIRNDANFGNDNGSAILVLVRPVIIETLADYVVDKDSMAPVSEYSLSNIPEVIRFLIQVERLLEESRLNPALFPTLAQESGMNKVRAFLIRYMQEQEYTDESEIFDSLENFNKMLEKWNEEKLKDKHIRIDPAYAENIYEHIKYTDASLTLVRPDMEEELENFLRFTLEVSEHVPPLLEDVYAVLAEMGIGKKIDRINFSFNKDSTRRVFSVTVLNTPLNRAEYQLSEECFDENYIARVLDINLAAPLHVELNPVLVLREIGQCIFDDSIRLGFDPVELDVGHIRSGIGYHGYFKRFSFNPAPYYGREEIYEDIVDDIRELVGWWFMLEAVEKMETALPAFKVQAKVAIGDFVSRAYELLEQGKLTVGTASVVFAVVYYANRFLDMDDLIQSAEFGQIGGFADTELEKDYEGFISDLGLKKLRDYRIALHPEAEPEIRRDAADSMVGRLSHNEFEPETAHTLGIAHDYKSISFENEELRDAALHALFTNPPSGSISIGFAQMFEISQPQLTGWNRDIVHFRDSRTNILAVPHPTKPILIFHVVREGIPSGVLDETDEELRNRTLGETHDILDYIADYTVETMQWNPDPEVRRAAYANFAQMGSEGAETLYSALLSEYVPSLLEEIVVALGNMGIELIPEVYYDENIVKNLVSLFAGPTTAYKIAGELLGIMQSDIAVQKASIQQAIDEGENLSTELAALQAKEDFIVEQILISLRSDRPIQERLAAANALRITGTKLALRHLIDILEDNSEDEDLQDMVAHALEYIPVVYEDPQSVVYVQPPFFQNLANTEFGQQLGITARDGSYLFSGGTIVIDGSLRLGEKEGLRAHETSHLVFNYKLERALSQALSVSATEPNKILRMKSTDPLGLIDLFSIAKDEDPDGIIPQDADAVLTARGIKDIRRRLLKVVSAGGPSVVDGLPDFMVDSCLKAIFGTELNPDRRPEESPEYIGHEMRIVGELIAMWNECRENPPLPGSPYDILYSLINGAITAHPEINSLIADLGLDKPQETAIGKSPRFADHILAARGTGGEYGNEPVGKPVFEGQFPDVEPMQNDSFDMIYVIHATKGRFEEHKEYLKGRIRAARKAGKKVKFLVEWGPDDNYKDKFVQELLAFYKRNPDEARREFQSYYKAAEIMFSQIIRGERTLAYLYEVISPRPTADFMYALFEFLKENHVEIVLEERNIESWVGAVYARKYQSEAFDYFIKGDFDKHLENIEKCYVYIKPADDKRDELLRSEIEQIMEEENIYLFSFRGNVHTGMEEGLMRRTYDVVTKQATDPLALEFGVDELDLKMRLGIPVSEAEKRNLLMKDNPCDLLAAYFEEVMKIDIVKARALAKGIVYSADVTEETLRELSAYLGTLEPANITRAVVYNWFDERGLVPKWVKEELTESSGVDEAIGHRSRSDDIRRFNTKACEVLEEMKLDESQAQQISIVEIKAEILDTINSEPEKEFSFEDIKKKIQLEVPNAELRGILDKLCKQGKLIKVEARLLELIRYYKEYIEPEQKQPQEKTFIERYKDSLIAVFGLTPTSQNISQIDKYLEAMRRNYEKMRQSCIANITIGKETIQHQQFALLERLAGERLNRDKIAPYFVHKLLEYITSSKLAGPSLEDFAEFMGMELGELPRAETSTRPQSINEHHLLFEKAA